LTLAITSREFRGEEDYQRVRELLVESYAITQRLHNWELARWDSFRFGAHWREEIEGARHWEADVHLWEMDKGQLVGVVNPEDRGDAFLQIHPHYRHLEEEMLDWAEAHHRALKPAGANPWPLNLFVYQYDKERVALLARRGYRNQGPDSVSRSCSLDGESPKVELPEGYAIRYPRGEDQGDLERQASVINRVFNANFTRDAVRVLRRVPTHCEDLVVVAPDGTFAAFCSIWFDEFNRTGTFEPVGTHPDHRRRGLAKAVMCEGLRQLKELGATVAFVGTGYDAPANRLYESVGFTEVDVVDRWQKEF
jgi:mycothiol synthase